jgi:hypothetical protein
MCAVVCTTGCIGVVTEKDLTPYRSGNVVGVHAAPYLFQLGISPEIDVITISLDGMHKQIFAQSNNAYREYYHFGIRTPQSHKVHAIVDVLYVNGTSIRIFEGDV